MAITLNGTTGISSPGGDTSTSLATTNLSYTGTLTGGTGVIAIGTNQIYKDASGNVGFGVTPSAWNSVYRAFDFGSLGGIASAANTVGIYTNVYVDSAFNSKYKTTNYATSYLQNSNGTGQHQWFIAPSGSAGGTISFTQAMTLDASGNLGVGSTSPVSRFEVAGSTPTVSVTPTTQNQATGINLRVLNAGTYGAARIEAVNTNTYDSNLLFYTNTSSSTTLVERARIDSSGNLLVGTTVTNPIVSTVTGLKYFTAGTLQVNASSAAAYEIGRYTSTGNMAAFYYGGPTLVGYISTNGTTITFSGNALSDARHKENVAKISNGLEAINSLDFVTFDFKESGRPSAGVTSQQAETVPEIAPFVVNGVTEEDYKAFDYNALIGYMGAAIQELTTRLEALEAKA